MDQTQTKHHCIRKRRLLSGCSGYTLLELCVTLLVLTSLSAAALPKIAEIDSSFNRLNSRSYLIQDLKRAQAEAITSGCRGIAVISPDGKSYRFGCDYLAYD